MRGDCSIRVGGLGFTSEQITAAVQARGLLSIELDLSSDSECGCEACAAAPQPVLSFEEIRGLLDQASALGARRCILVDSPTTSHPRLGDLLRHLSGRGIEIELFTDGNQLTAEFATFLRERRVAVVVRVDPLVCTSAAVDTLRQAGYCTAGAPCLAARAAVRRENIDALPRWWRWARSLGIEPYVQIITPRSAALAPSPGVPGEGTVARPPATGVTPGPQRIKQLFQELGGIDREEFGRSWEHPPELTGRSCKRHLFACHVTPCGTIFACVGVTIPLGNIRTQTLWTILDESEVLENLRAFGQKVKEPCRTCCKTTDCYGCRGAAYQLTGDYLAGDQLCWKAEGMSIPSLPIATGAMIPHGPSMRMADRIVTVGEREARIEFVVRSDSLFVDARGRLDETAYIEMIAQSFAASHGFHLSTDELALHRGMLLGVKDLRIVGTARVGDRLVIHLKKVARFGDFGVVEGMIYRDDGTLLAKGEVKIWRPSAEAEKALLT